MATVRYRGNISFPVELFPTLYGLALLSILLFALPFRGGAAPMDSEELKSFKDGPLTMIFHVDDEGFARAVSQRGKRVYRRIEEDLALSEAPEAAIFLLTSRVPSDITARWKEHLPRWIGGIAYTGRRLIVLPVRPGQTPRDLDEVIAHELTHVILKGDYREYSAWPAWFKEGLSMWVSRSEGWRSFKELSFAAMRRQLIPLDELWTGFPDNEPEARLAYAQSYSFIAYLIKRNGLERFRHLLQRLRSDEFEPAFRSAFREGTGPAEEAWRRYVRKRYNWIPLVTGGTALWGLTLLVFFAAVAARRRRSNLIRERWEEEELHSVD